MRQSVKDYMDKNKTDDEREQIKLWFNQHGMTNPFQASARARDIRDEKLWEEEKATRTYTPIPATAPPRPAFDNVVGLKDAQREMVLGQNEERYSPGDYMVYWGAEKDLDQAIDRAIAGKLLSFPAACLLVKLRMKINYWDI